MRPTGVRKITNGYALAVGNQTYAQIPKAVWAAIAVSCATQGGDYLDEAKDRVMREWGILHMQGIVPQAPPGYTPPTDEE